MGLPDRGTVEERKHGGDQVVVEVLERWEPPYSPCNNGSAKMDEIPELTEAK